MTAIKYRVAAVMEQVPFLCGIIAGTVMVVTKQTYRVFRKLSTPIPIVAGGTSLQIRRTFKLGLHS
jgi:hypothetical protein